MYFYPAFMSPDNFKKRQKIKLLGLTEKLGFDISCPWTPRWKGDRMKEKVVIYGKAG